MRVCHYCAILLTTSISNANLSTDDTSNLSATATALSNISAPTNSNTNPKAEIDTTKLEIIDGSLSTDLQFFHTISRISTMEFGHWQYSASFPFELEELSTMPLFSGAALEEKPITVMYTDAKVDGHSIKLILDNGSAGSIITKQLMNQLGHQVDYAASARIITADGATKTLIGKIDDFFFKVNGIIILIKILVMEATQYQALTTNLTTPFIKFEEKKKKPTWEAYQLPPILSWDKPKKGKQREKLTWETDDLTWTNNNNNQLTSNWD
ncbi:hypothetical protein G9A89_007311 [Geosiphon pyriformis]|nr:hypothetical protein G9A89_007311 [Geosiphon pyriformis]